MKLKRGKKAQVSVEYLIIMGFVTMIILVILATAYLYADIIRDKIKVNQVELYAEKIISSAENLFYSGAPARATISTYLPKGVESVNVGEDRIIVTYSTSSGMNIRGFPCRVPIEGILSNYEGTHTIHLQAQEYKVLIS